MEENYCFEHECPLVEGMCMLEWVESLLAGQSVHDLVVNRNSLDLVFTGGHTLMNARHPGWLDRVSFHYVQLDANPDKLLDQLVGNYLTGLRFISDFGADCPTVNLVQFELFPDPQVDLQDPNYEPVLVLVDFTSILEWYDHVQIDTRCPD